MPWRWTAPAVTVHYTQSDAGRESHYERRREEVYDGGDLRLAVIVRHHYAAVHAAVMAGEFRAFVAQFAGEILAVDDRRIAATFDVHQQHRLHVAWRWHCRNYHNIIVFFIYLLLLIIFLFMYHFLFFFFYYIEESFVLAIFNWSNLLFSIFVFNSYLIL